MSMIGLQDVAVAVGPGLADHKWRKRRSAIWESGPSHHGARDVPDSQHDIVATLGLQ